MVGGRGESLYGTVSTICRLADTGVGVGLPAGGLGWAQVKAVTGQLAPVKLKTNCDELTVLGAFVAQPVNTFSPTTLTTNKSSTCRRRRFLKPKKPSRAAMTVPGNIGPESWRRLEVVLGTVTVRVVVPVAPAS